MDKTLAAERAGYAADSAQTEAHRLLQQPHILAGVQIMIAKRLASGAPMALNVLQELIQNPAMHPKLRLDAAKDWLNRAGHIAPKAVAAGQAGDVPLNEMTMTDLRALADKLEGEIAGRAKDVSSAKRATQKAQTIEDIM